MDTTPLHDRIHVPVAFFSPKRKIDMRYGKLRRQM